MFYPGKKFDILSTPIKYALYCSRQAYKLENIFCTDKDWYSQKYESRNIVTVDNSCLTENVCVYYSKMNAVNSNYQKCFLSKKKVWYNRMYLELVLLRVRIFSCYIKYLFSEMKLRDGCDIRQEFMDYCTSILKMAVQKKMITTSDFHQQRKRRKLSAVREKSRVPVPVFKRSQYRANECPRSGCRLT